MKRSGMHKEMIARSLANRLVFITLVMVHFGCVYGISYTNKLLHCAVFFVSSLSLSQALLRKYSTKITTPFIHLNILLNFMLLQKLNLLVISSFVGIFLATMVSNRGSVSLNGRKAFISSMFVSNLLAVLADVVIMLGWELQTFGREKALLIASKSLGYKAGVLLMYAFVLLIYRSLVGLVSNRRSYDVLATQTKELESCRITSGC